jgi:hypothetical protein
MQRMWQQGTNDHFQKLLVAREGTRNIACLFEQWLASAADVSGRAVLARMLAEADQLIADMDEEVNRNRSH